AGCSPSGKARGKLLPWIVRRSSTSNQRYLLREECSPSALRLWVTPPCSPRLPYSTQAFPRARPEGHLESPLSTSDPSMQPLWSGPSQAPAVDRTTLQHLNSTLPPQRGVLTIGT